MAAHTVTDLERRLGVTETHLPVDSRIPLDPSISLLPRYQGISSDLRLPETRLQDPRLGEHRGVLQSSPPFSYQGTSNNNMAILEQSRALSTVSLPVNHSNYPIISPHGLFGSSNPVTTLSSTYLPSSPNLSSAFLYSHLYSTASATNYQPGMYVQTSEGRTLELLGGDRVNDGNRQRTMTPSTGLPALTAPQVTESLDPQKNTLLNLHDNTDPTGVWRPY